MDAGTPLGKVAGPIMAAGNLVSDDLMLGLLEERFAQPDTRNGFVLDGYPRNLAQAAALDELLERLGQPMDVAVQLDVGNELLVERLAGRAKLEGRADDTPESVRNRLKLYDDVTAPVIEHYRKQGKLAHLDGVGTLDAVFTRIIEAINPTSDVG